MDNVISINTGSGSNTTIIEKPQASVKRIRTNGFAIAKDVTSTNPDIVVKDILKTNLQRIEQKNIIELKAMDKLQFRIRFIRIDPVGFTSNTPAPVGIAIIGVNNYIL